MHRRGVVVALAVVVLVAGAVVVWRLLAREDDYERAVAWLPEDSLRVTWTDWAAVRSDVGAPGPGARGGAVAGFLDRAYEADLSSGSAVAESTAVLDRRYGFSPLDVGWEVFGQGRGGQVVVLSLPESADVAGIEGRLRRLGYDAPPDGPGTDGTWQGGADLVASIDPMLTPVMQNMAVVAEERLVVMSDAPGPVSATVEVIAGDAEGLDAPLTGVAGTPKQAWLWADDFACEDLTMSNADPEDQRLASQLVDEAGGVNPLSGLVMARQPDDSLTIGMRFENDDQASANLQPRVDLAAGEAPGQGGTFGERFRITSGEADGVDVVIRAEPREEFQLSDITSGPVLFATC